MSQKKSAEKFVEHEVQVLWELENFIASNPDPRELGSDKYVVIRYSLAQNIVIIMNKIPNSTNMVF